jgi:hypothetical protein
MENKDRKIDEIATSIQKGRDAKKPKVKW